MSSLIELHDSELLRIEEIPGGSCALTLDVYIHRRGGDAVDPYDGGYQTVTITLQAFRIERDCPPLPADIRGGSLRVNDTDYGLIPLPLEQKGAIRIQLEFLETSGQAVISGQDISVQPAGEFRFFEKVDFS